MGTPKDSERTRARIIETAGELFADKGFKAVTVREIAQKADTHLSALNYHFKAKDSLYREVVLEACKTLAWSNEDIKSLLTQNPSEALKYIIRVSIDSYYDQGTSKWQTAIISRECWQPSDVFSDIIDNYFRNHAGLMAEVISKITDKPVNSNRIMFAVFSLIGQLDTFGMYAKLIDEIAPDLNNRLKQNNNLENLLYRLVLETAVSAEELD